jgi:hypothetical protein
MRQPLSFRPLQPVNPSPPGRERALCLAGPLSLDRLDVFARHAARSEPTEWFILLDETGTDPLPLLSHLHVALGRQSFWIGRGASSTEAAGEALTALAALSTPRRFLYLPPSATAVDLEKAGWRRCPVCHGTGARPASESEVCFLCPRCLGRGETEAPLIGAVVLFHASATFPPLTGAWPEDQEKARVIFLQPSPPAAS